MTNSYPTTVSDRLESLQRLLKAKGFALLATWPAFQVSEILEGGRIPLTGYRTFSSLDDLEHFALEA